MMKVLATIVATMATTPALATVRFSSGQSDPFIAIVLSVVATAGLTVLVRFLLRRRTSMPEDHHESRNDHARYRQALGGASRSKRKGEVA